MSINLSVMPEPSAMLGAAGVATLGAGLVSPRPCETPLHLFFLLFFLLGRGLGLLLGLQGLVLHSPRNFCWLRIGREGEGLFFSRWTSASRASTSSAMNPEIPAVRPHLRSSDSSSCPPALWLRLAVALPKRQIQSIAS